ncbi:glycosyltransferase family 2 protein [Streptomyces sp. NPDC051740]|uniref:glycosyltransferase family 2 protein n=1 Tax=Streptomyces sp. NPDC051740 TaxID=3365673 RepID=UPI00379162E1
MAIRMVCMVGGDTSLLGPAIEHYRRLGVDRFHMVRHADSLDDPAVAASEEVMRRAGLAFSRVVVGPWHEHLNPAVIRETMSEHPDDWWVVADLDEFQLYPDGLTAVIAYCERNGYDFVQGAFLDRVASDGTLPEPDRSAPEALWRQYGLAGLLTLRLLHARPTKVTLARGRTELSYGQHNSWSGRSVPPGDIYAQVHHFKWTGSACTRLARRAESYASGAWEINNSVIIEESLAFLEHVDAHGGRIDVSDSSFGFLPCGEAYTDYVNWPEVAAELAGRYTEFDAGRARRRRADPTLRL